MKKSLGIVMFLFFFCLAGCTYNKSFYESSDDNCTVLLDESENFSINSENPIVVKRGENAVFNVSLNEGYAFSISDEYTFSTTTITFLNIQRSKTVYAKTEKIGSISLSVINDDSKGVVSIIPDKQKFNLGETVSVKVEPKNDNKFVCWSNEKSIHGKNDCGTPISFKKEYVFQITSDTIFYANYHDADTYLMEYDLNGGTTFENLDSLIFDYKCQGYRMRPNSLCDINYFSNDGYYLESYNTKKDGTGTRIGIGSRINLNLFDKNKSIKLYCQWMKESDLNDFTFSLKEDGYEVSLYSGNDKDVIIPNEYNGVSVIGIDENSFVNNSNIIRLYLNKNLNYVKEFAFDNCPNLSELHFWSSTVDIIDTCFTNCDELKTIFINCNSLPKYLNYFSRGNLSDRLDNAESLCLSSKTILGIGSSTISYNHDFLAMSENVGNGYVCYNLSCLFEMPLQVMYYLALSLCGSDDSVLIQLHETQAARVCPKNAGLTFGYLEGDFDRILSLNYQCFDEFLLNCWKNYKNTTSSMNDLKSYEYYDFGLKQFGDYVWESTGIPTIDNKGDGYLSIASYSENNFSYINDIHSNFPTIKTFLTFDTYNSNAIIDDSSFYTFENLITNLFSNKITIISKMKDSFLPGIDFRYKDNIHLNELGGLNHSRQIGTWIKNVLEA